MQLHEQLCANVIADVESRFSFHSIHEFPAPDAFTDCAKTYPSIVTISKQTSEFALYYLRFSVV